MNTDGAIDLAQVPTSRYFLKDETHRIIGCSFEVLNQIGNGFYEKIYENALVVEFEAAGISYEQQKQFDIVYRQRTVGFYIPDLIAFGEVIVETKTIDKNWR